MKSTLKTRTLAFTGALTMALVLTSASQRAFAQTGTVGTVEGEKVSLEQNVYGLGTNFSLMSGIGLSFKEHFANSRFSYMVTGYVNIDNSGGGGGTYDYGAEAQYDIYLKKETRFYVLGGLGYFYQGAPVSTPDPIGNIKQSIQNSLAGPLRLGAGAGFESGISSTACFYLNLTVTSFQPSGDLFIYPYAGFMFYFK